jgi:two-component system, NtrC family, sensor histidine kinase PilS
MQKNQHSWFGSSEVDSNPADLKDSQEMLRLWQGFMTARLTLGVVLLGLQVAIFTTGTSQDLWLVAISAGYCSVTIATRLLIRPRPLGRGFNRIWGALVGLDVLAFSAMQLLQQSGVGLNYTPLFALPILLASVLGSLRLAMGTAAGVTMLLLLAAIGTYIQSATDARPHFIQAALSGVGYFVIAFLSNQLASRLAQEGQRARLNQLAANVQREVNELVIESLSDGVLIVDDRGVVRAANPSARQLLGSARALRGMAFGLQEEGAWAPLLDLTRLSLGTSAPQEVDITIRHRDHGPLRLRARTRIAAPQGPEGESLCVLFLQDQRELEARMRTEKLAGMGRLSTAVAHEIRNPLAAIAQANALLDEDLVEPHLKKLTLMVGQNAKRLEKIVNEILNIARVQPHEANSNPAYIHLAESTQRICTDWVEQNGTQQQFTTSFPVTEVTVRFDSDHLRRVLVNLLDNAKRYASPHTDAIQVHCSSGPGPVARIAVWSDGAPMDQSVERHLFEPFFSSESRSSGLGLYICRELCESHGASILYQRQPRVARGQVLDGNEFVIRLVTPTEQDHSAHRDTSDHP